MSLSKWCFRRFTPSVEIRHCRSNTEQESRAGNSNSDYKYNKHGLYRNYHLSGQHCLFIIHSEQFIPENSTGPASVHCHPKIGLATVSINTTLTAHTHVSNAAGQARCTQIFIHTHCQCSASQIRTWDLKNINISCFDFYFVYECYICIPPTCQVVHRGQKKISDVLEL